MIDVYIKHKKEIFMKLKKYLYTLMAAGMIMTMLPLSSIKTEAATKEEYMVGGFDAQFAERCAIDDEWNAGKLTPAELKARYDAIGIVCLYYPPYQEAYDVAFDYAIKYPDSGILNLRFSEGIDSQYKMINYYASLLDAGTITQKQCHEAILSKATDDGDPDVNLAYAKSEVAKILKRDGKNPTTKKSADKAVTYDYTKVFDAKYYAAKYPNLAKAGITTDAALLENFKSVGMQNLLQGNAAFNPVSYLQNNADLVAKYGTDYAKYYQHYMTTGCNENRIH